MPILDGRELAGYIKERQAREVRSLRQAQSVVPKLAIIRTNLDEVADSYMRQKQTYAKGIGIEVEVHTIEQSKATELIRTLNTDASVHGIIVQIPLPDVEQTEEVLNSVAPDKDVDGLAKNSKFDPATPIAINWLLAGYNIDLAGKHIVLVGHGRLVGRPLARIWQASGLDVEIADKYTTDLAAMTRTADVLVCATGVPRLIKPDMIKPEVVIVDAGVASDAEGLVGDVSPEVRDLPSVTITPLKGGVGPLTVCALFDNVLRSARASVVSS